MPTVTFQRSDFTFRIIYDITRSHDYMKCSKIEWQTSLINARLFMNIAICDDDVRVAKSLKEMIVTNIDQDVQGINVFSSAEEMMFHIEDNMYDIIFMDIELGEESGIQLSKKIKAKYPTSEIVFISGFDDYYLDVYDVEHVYFLRKPITIDKLQAAVDFASKNLQESSENYLTVVNRKSINRVPMSAITYLEKNKRVIIVHTIDGKEYQMYGKFDELMGALSSSFVQCHYSFVVNMKYINSISDKKVYVADEFEIPISKSRFAATKDAFFEYIG